MREFADNMAGDRAAEQPTSRLRTLLRIRIKLGARHVTMIVEVLLDRIEYARQILARVLSGGQQLTDGDLAKGYFVPTTVSADVKDDMRIAREEIFGPVISAIPFTDIEEVIERSNSTHFGLGAGIWTKDVGKAHKLARGIRSGSVLTWLAGRPSIFAAVGEPAISPST
jgi:acyl-CoA reductase-like NAD-dependent aldehyde dehydrogenase